MSVFTLDTKPSNPVTIKHVDDICDSLGVTIRADEKEAYRTLLAVYHESMESLMALGGTSSPENNPKTPSNILLF